MRQFNHLHILRVFHTSPDDLTQDSLPYHSIWITKFLSFIKISPKSFSTGTPTVVNIDINIYVYQSPLMLINNQLFICPPINLNFWRLPTVISLYSYIPYFVNSTTGWWSITYFTNIEYAAKDTSVNIFYTSLSIQDDVFWLYHVIIPPYHIIFSDQFHIKY